MENNIILSQLYDGIELPDSVISGPVWMCSEKENKAALAMNTRGYETESRILSAVNCYYNHGSRYYEPFENYYTRGVDFDDKTVGIIGYMPQVERINPSAERYYYFDMNPDVPALPAEAEKEYLPACDIVVITASSIINNTLSGIISMCPKAYKILVGASAPMSEALFDFGIDRIGGIVLEVSSELEKYVITGERKKPFFFGKPFLMIR